MLRKLRSNVDSVYIVPLRLMYYEAVYSIVTGLDVMNYRLSYLTRRNDTGGGW